MHNLFTKSTAFYRLGFWNPKGIFILFPLFFSTIILLLWGHNPSPTSNNIHAQPKHASPSYVQFAAQKTPDTGNPSSRSIAGKKKTIRKKLKELKSLWKDYKQRIKGGKSRGDRNVVQNILLTLLAAMLATALGMLVFALAIAVSFNTDSTLAVTILAMGWTIILASFILVLRKIYSKQKPKKVLRPKNMNDRYPY